MSARPGSESAPADPPPVHIHSPADLGLRLWFAALLSSDESMTAAEDDARTLLPIAKTILHGDVLQDDYRAIPKRLRAAALAHSALADEPTITGIERDEIMARAGFNVGIATGYLLMQAQHGGAR